MVSLLLESDASANVSLEVFEDVGVETSGGTLASQTKSSIEKNPVSNSAEPFWKTLHNWLDAIKAGQLALEKTVFELYVFGDFQGEICSFFSDATSGTEAQAAISKAKRMLGVGSRKLSAHIDAVLSADEELLKSLILRFRYRHGSGESIEDLRAQLNKSFVPKELVDHVLTHAMGWVKEKVDTLLERGQLAAIKVADFQNEIATYTRALAFSSCLADLAGPADPEDIEQNRSRRYVRQLELILVSDERKLRAISAYLRSSVNRTEWGRMGLVHEHSLDDFAQKLLEYWQNSRTQCEILLESKGVNERGQYLLAECMKCNSSLQGRPVPHDFVEGCFHSLADDLTVGWHPAFEELTISWK
jgi:hypothetical protein